MSSGQLQCPVFSFARPRFDQGLLDWLLLVTRKNKTWTVLRVGPTTTTTTTIFLLMIMNYDNE